MAAFSTRVRGPAARRRSLAGYRMTPLFSCLGCVLSLLVQTVPSLRCFLFLSPLLSHVSFQRSACSATRSQRARRRVVARIGTRRKWTRGAVSSSARHVPHDANGPWRKRVVAGRRTHIRGSRMVTRQESWWVMSAMRQTRAGPVSRPRHGSLGRSSRPAKTQVTAVPWTAWVRRLSPRVLNSNWSWVLSALPLANGLLRLHSVCLLDEEQLCVVSHSLP